MAMQFDTLLDEDRPVSECRALVPVSRYPRGYEVEDVTPADAVFLATLIAHSGAYERARTRKAAAPAEAISKYRAGGSLADDPGVSALRVL